MLFRLILAAAMSKLGQEILIDLYKKYIATSNVNYSRKDYRR
ncbi:hypothetical protein SEA_SCAP1_38 [Streptomyces phage Scap1]|uniref:Uncharacterized protein n=1 Tax=Streptomyces phage Scap1 TaxID=2041354 RepID=A0A2D1GNT9_9CAUD|nr:hypothetical protein FDI71_gp38 [Streptomyces phage Scap1]ATN93687.1 hypothetical protein SEA_SCAP1_38 [Streptomyces phage Scap1]